MRKKSKKNHHLMLIVFIIFLIGAYVALFRQPIKYADEYVQKPSALTQSRTHTSDVLDISFVVPERYEVEENFNFIKLKLGIHKILIDRIGTNHSDVTGYINDLEEKNKLNIVERSLIEGKYDIVRANVINPYDRQDDEKSYFIYPDEWTIYTISTSSPELYDDLEQIVQSFEYLGE